jgi:hypothetical protein
MEEHALEGHRPGGVPLLCNPARNFFSTSHESNQLLGSVRSESEMDSEHEVS